MNDKKFGWSKFKKIINRGGWNKEQEPGGEGGCKKIKKLIRGVTSVRTLRVYVAGRKRCKL